MGVALSLLLRLLLLARNAAFWALVILSLLLAPTALLASVMLPSSRGGIPLSLLLRLLLAEKAAFWAFDKFDFRVEDVDAEEDDEVEGGCGGGGADGSCVEGTSMPGLP